MQQINTNANPQTHANAGQKSYHLGELVDKVRTVSEMREVLMRNGWAIAENCPLVTSAYCRALFQKDSFGHHIRFASTTESVSSIQPSKSSAISSCSFARRKISTMGSSWRSGTFRQSHGHCLRSWSWTQITKSSIVITFLKKQRRTPWTSKSSH